MKSAAALRFGGPVARSLRITGSTRTLSAALAAAISLNGLVAIQAVGVVGQAAVLAMAFASISVCSAAITTDVINRSAKAISDLRSIGASRESISSAIFRSMLVYGLIGSAGGGVFGAVVGSALTGGAYGSQTLVEVLAVVSASGTALAAGSYAGGRSAWRN